MDKDQIRSIVKSALADIVFHQGEELLNEYSNSLANKLVSECTWSAKISAGYKPDATCERCNGPVENGDIEMCHKCRLISIFDFMKRHVLTQEQIRDNQNLFEMFNRLDPYSWQCVTPEITRAFEGLRDAAQLVGTTFRNFRDTMIEAANAIGMSSRGIMNASAESLPTIAARLADQARYHGFPEETETCNRIAEEVTEIIRERSATEVEEMEREAVEEARRERLLEPQAQIEQVDLRLVEEPQTEIFDLGFGEHGEMNLRLRLPVRTAQMVRDSVKRDIQLALERFVGVQNDAITQENIKRTINNLLQAYQARGAW